MERLYSITGELNGGYTCCPLCQKKDLDEEKTKAYVGILNLFIKEGVIIVSMNDKGDYLYYCLNCEILFGTTHAIGYDRENDRYLYNVALIDGYELYNEKFDSFPVFNNIVAARQLIYNGDMRIRNFRCSCGDESHTLEMDVIKLDHSIFNNRDIFKEYDEKDNK